jgi:CRP/FNR family cyclic AMP-dependent transcriptional regulator
MYGKGLLESKTLRRRAQHKTCKRGETIILPGQPARKIYILTEGTAAAVYEHEDKEYIAGHIYPGDIFGEAGLFGKPRGNKVIARETCSLLAINNEDFLMYANRHPEAWHALLQQQYKRLQQSNQSASSIACSEVEKRVREKLAELAETACSLTHPDGALIRVTRTELGKMLGCTREMVSRVMSIMEKKGIIKTEGQATVLLGVKRPAQPPVLHLVKKTGL